ncbi:hypothetical protein GTY54_06840, partial [Streptomyces sp. SID625]|nr:hypothetical protein [Streptomyces sp. SID625]
ERLRDRLAGLHTAEGAEGKAREALEEAIADELRANPALTNPEIAEHVPWAQEQIRLIARAHNVPRRRKRGSEHRLITDDKGNPKSVVVPYAWYVRQRGTDPSIVKR